MPKKQVLEEPEQEEIYTRVLYFEGGVEVEIEYPESIAVDVDDDIEKYAKQGGVWYAEDYIHLRATMNGKNISHLNMSKFIGMV